MGKNIEGFVFYRSFYEAILEIPNAKTRLEALEAILKYAFDGEETKLSGMGNIVYVMAKPLIDANIKKQRNGEEAAKYGTLGGRPKKSEKPSGDEKEKPPGFSKQKPPGFSDEKPIGLSESDADEKPQIEIKKEIEIESKKESKKETKTKRHTQASLVGESDLSDPVKEKLLEWLQYKQEKRDGYKETGLKSLITETRRHEQESGSIAVINLITECMANGWRGIIWDKLKSQPIARSGTTGNVFDDWAAAARRVEERQNAESRRDNTVPNENPGGISQL